MDRVVSHFDVRRCARSALIVLLVAWVSAADVSQASEYLRRSTWDSISLIVAFQAASPDSPVNFLAQRIVQCTEETWSSSTPFIRDFCAVGDLQLSTFSSHLHHQFAAIEPSLIAAIPDSTQVRLRL